MPRRKEPRISDALLDQLLGGADAKTAFDPSGLLDELKKALAERALNAEIDHHLEGVGRRQRSHSPPARPKRTRRLRSRQSGGYRGRNSGRIGMIRVKHSG